MTADKYDTSERTQIAEEASNAINNACKHCGKRYEIEAPSAGIPRELLSV